MSGRSASGTPLPCPHACLLAALGDPNTLLLSEAVEASYSIRVAIAHAGNVGPVDARAML